MPRLNVTINVHNRPLRRAYVEHIVLGGGGAMYMTDDLGRVRDEGGNLGIESFTRNADIRVLCQNSVVKVLDGSTVPVPLAVNQDKAVVDGSVVNLNTNAEQHEHYVILNSCLLTYDVVFRQFRPFSDLALPDFPLGRSSSLRTTKDNGKRIEVSFPSQFPLGTLAFSEPKSVATSYPLIHIRSRSSDGRLFGEHCQLPTLIPSELAHALHFSLFSESDRQAIQNDYIGWIASDIANGGNGTHAMGVRTSPKVAYIEALDHLSSRFSEFVRQVVQGVSTTRVYFGSQTVVAMIPYLNGVITAFTGTGIYFSPDGQNLGGGGNTTRVYSEDQTVVAMIPYLNGVITAFTGACIIFSPDGQNLGGDNTPLLPQAVTDQIRQDFLAREVSGAPVTGTAVATIGAGGGIVPNASFNGTDDEGSVYGCIFVDFARRVGLRTAVTAYLRSAASGAISFGEYKTWISNNRPQNLGALNAAQVTWGL